MTPSEMRARFHDLGRRRQEITAKTTPLREEYSRLAEQQRAIKAQMAEVARRRKQIEADEKLFEIDQERAAISRSLKGKTGAPE
ncbi:MAG: hypothetical protein AB7O43_17710 [Hyphomicrobiaceae bacterium]